LTATTAEIAVGNRCHGNLILLGLQFYTNAKTILFSSAICGWYNLLLIGLTPRRLWASTVVNIIPAWSRMKIALKTILSVWPLAFLAGALMGLFILRPINDFVAFHEHEVAASSAANYVWGELAGSLQGKKPTKTAFYAVAGGVIGLFYAVFHIGIADRNRRINRLTAELEKDVEALIAQGESGELEFKSSLRWDFKENRVNRALEAPVLKTLAGFLNGRGGTLLIGVGDDGAVVGLEQDYQTLKKKNRDGFEQAVVAAVATKLGGDIAPCVQIVFHSIAAHEICRLIVSPAPRPVYVDQEGSPKFFLRSGASTREMNVREGIEWIATRWQK
jgi:hypothetical protein